MPKRRRLRGFARCRQRRSVQHRGRAPNWKLVVPCESTQLIGTLVVYGLFMAPTGWPLVLMVWGYSVVSFMVVSGLKIGTYWLLEHSTGWQARHLAQFERSLRNST
jgi:H+-transporting ATPase